MPPDSNDSPHSPGLPGRHRPQLSELSRETTEEDLWNLDEEEPTTVLRAPQPLRPPPAKATSGGLVIGGASTPTPAARSAETPPPPAPTKRAAAPEPPTRTEELSTEPKPQSTPQASETEESALRDFDDEFSASDKAKPSERPASDATNRRRDLISIAAFAALLLIGVVWVLSQFFGHFKFDSDPYAKPDFPVTGDIIRVSQASVFWREPIREGEARDVARRDVLFLPVLDLSLEPGPRDQGAIRVIFRNSSGDPVGDPITRTFSGGRFDASGSESVALPATSGFTGKGNFEEYRTGRHKFWTVDVLEAPTAGAPASEFKLVATLTAYPIRR